MKSNRTHTAPPQVEDLGDGTFYYNFQVEVSPMEDGANNYDYLQVRCDLPAVDQEIQEEIDNQGYDHIVILD